MHFFNNLFSIQNLFSHKQFQRKIILKKYKNIRINQWLSIITWDHIHTATTIQTVLARVIITLTAWVLVDFWILVWTHCRCTWACHNWRTTSTITAVCARVDVALTTRVLVNCVLFVDQFSYAADANEVNQKSKCEKVLHLNK